MNDLSKKLISALLAVIMVFSAVPVLSASAGIFDPEPPFECELNGQHQDMNGDNICDCCGKDLNGPEAITERTENKVLPYENLFEMIKDIIRFFFELFGIKA